MEQHTLYINIKSQQEAGNKQKEQSNKNKNRDKEKQHYKRSTTLNPSQFSQLIFSNLVRCVSHRKTS
ncbi:hypothetical protein HanXRQr2_Chr10g0422451 [Helianthus annuus]|uniref:Uncharacterized protein n=1 Tax=Helianthus annuus TaxID=4232 RepID=A0A9K3HV15_HELAN|nr:hypothetical protein HanXRQr2_Chr10g0422451 [Helianthus annuus]